MCMSTFIILLSAGSGYYYKFIRTAQKIKIPEKVLKPKIEKNYKDRQTISDLGNTDLPGKLARDWYDIQKQGKKNDYCAYLGQPAIWNCALAGESGYSVEDETEDNAARVPGHRPRQSIGDLGYPDKPGILTKGWYDVQDQGINNDYCAYTGNGTKPENWSCALAGENGFKHQDESESTAVRIPINQRQTISDEGYEDQPGKLIRGWFDLQNQGNKNDYCSYTGIGWGCALGGSSGYVQKDENSFPWRRTPAIIDKGYSIRGDQGKCITVANNSKDNNAQIEMRDCDNSNLGQQFNQIPNNFGYSIQNVNSGKCVDVPFGDSNRTIQQYDCNSTAAQQWAHNIQHGDNDKRILSPIGVDSQGVYHLCLNISGGRNNNGDNLIVYLCSEDGANQHWSWIKNY